MIFFEMNSRNKLAMDVSFCKNGRFLYEALFCSEMRLSSDESLFIKDSIVISVFRLITPAIFPSTRIIYPHVFHKNVPLIPPLPQLVCSFSIDFQSKEAHVLQDIPKKVRSILPAIFSSINTSFRSIHRCPLNTQEESMNYMLNKVSFFIFKKSYMQFLPEKPLKWLIACENCLSFSDQHLCRRLC